jgi:leucyl aminopeptidase
LLVELSRAADGTMPSEPPPGVLALVGKGVTFDSGGLSLKSSDSMAGMHTDKAGAAAILGALSTLDGRASAHSVHAVLPLAENMPGPDATRPGDVIITHAGIGVEVLDTDFEGRVMLDFAGPAVTGSGCDCVSTAFGTRTLQALVLDH